MNVLYDECMFCMYTRYRAMTQDSDERIKHLTGL